MWKLPAHGRDEIEGNDIHELRILELRLRIPSLKRIESRIFSDVFRGWSNRLRRSSEVALMKSPDLVQREGSNDGVQNAAVVEEHEVLL